ncbi:hypothetical protein DFH06DRAFT_1305957 [Mycena polygramma]|nr:hypothetical protein DFH06DRAFT_1305957 [Mycena polygramma]
MDGPSISSDIPHSHPEGVAVNFPSANFADSKMAPGTSPSGASLLASYIIQPVMIGSSSLNVRGQSVYVAPARCPFHGLMVYSSTQEICSPMTGNNIGSNLLSSGSANASLPGYVINVRRSSLDVHRSEPNDSNVADLPNCPFTVHQTYPVRTIPLVHQSESIGLRGTAPVLTTHYRTQPVSPPHTVNSNELELWYKFIGVSAQPQCSRDILTVSCKDIAAFVGSHRYLTADNMQSLAEAHSVSTQLLARQDLHRNVLKKHMCDEQCPGFRIYKLFQRLRSKRRLNIPTVDLTQLQALSILYSSDRETQEPGFITSFSLNRNFQFICCGSAQDVMKIDLRALTVCHMLPVTDRKPDLANTSTTTRCKADSSRERYGLKSFLGNLSAYTLGKQKHPVIQTVKEVKSKAGSVFNSGQTPAIRRRRLWHDWQRAMAARRR